MYKHSSSTIGVARRVFGVQTPKATPMKHNMYSGFRDVSFRYNVGISLLFCYYLQIPSLQELHRVSSKIEKLWLEGNPLCEDLDPITYVKNISIKFPRLIELVCKYFLMSF